MINTTLNQEMKAVLTQFPKLISYKRLGRNNCPWVHYITQFGKKIATFLSPKVVAQWVAQQQQQQQQQQDQWQLITIEDGITYILGDVTHHLNGLYEFVFRSGSAYQTRNYKAIGKFLASTLGIDIKAIYRA